MVATARHYGYLLRGQITGLFKVGITKNPKNRLRGYRTHTPEKITAESVKTFVSQAEARDWEVLVMLQHAEDVIHGEWLDIGFEEAAELCQLGVKGPDYISVWRGSYVVYVVETEFAERVTRIFRPVNYAAAVVLIAKLEQYDLTPDELIAAPREIDTEYLLSLGLELPAGTAAPAADHPEADGW